MEWNTPEEFQRMILERMGIKGGWTPPIIPHTSEWFEDMMQKSPQTAFQSMQMVELAGTEECCGACGVAADESLDTDDSDWVENWIDTRHNITFRLCNDCKAIQEQMNGYKFEMLTVDHIKGKI